MEKACYTKILNSVKDNLYGFLFSVDEKYVENLVKNLGRTKEDARSLGAWDWTHGVGLYGMYKLYEFTKDEQYLNDIERWFEDRLEIGLPDRNVNTVAPLLSMAFLHELRPHDEYKKIMDEWAEWIMNTMKRTEEGGIQHEHAELENNQELWDDTLLMTVLFLSKYGRMTGNENYIEEAKYQFLLHTKYLFDSSTGLWFHGWNFVHRDHFAGALWGRGNCWVSVFIPDFIDILQPEESFKRYAVGFLNNQADALRQYQDESGLWHTLINDETSYLEASATAGFTYGMLKGIRLGYLSKENEKCAYAGLKAILSNITDEGELSNVSYGTNVGRTLQHYKDIPLAKMHYGQSLALLALIEGINVIDTI